MILNDVSRNFLGWPISVGCLGVAVMPSMGPGQGPGRGPGGTKLLEAPRIISTLKSFTFDSNIHSAACDEINSMSFFFSAYLQFWRKF